MAQWQSDTAAPVVEVAVPVHNEAPILETSVRKLHDYLSEHFPFSWRIAIVDNGSCDGTLTVARRLAVELSGVRVVHLESKGRGGALRSAWMTSDADVLAYTDVDLSTGLDALLPLVAPLVSGHSDLAIGSRLQSGANVARGPKRELISRGYNIALRVAFSTRVHDAQCGFKAVRSDVARRLLPEVVDESWFFDTELLLLAEYNGYRIHEVPVDWIDDPASSVDIRRTVLADLRGMARLTRAFALGGARVERGEAGRRPFADDMGRRLITFAAIGTVSTLASLVLFLVLRASLGPVTAVIVALLATSIGNSWCHRRFTLGHRGRTGLVRHAVRSGAVAVCGIVLSAFALVGVDAAGAGLPAELAALAVVWTATTLLRLAMLSRSTA